MVGGPVLFVKTGPGLSYGCRPARAMGASSARVGVPSYTAPRLREGRLMVRSFVAVIVLALMPGVAPAVGPPPAAWRARAELESLARYLRFFEYDEFAFGRFDS